MMEEHNFAEEVKKEINRFKDQEPYKQMAIAVNAAGLKILERSVSITKEEKLFNCRTSKKLYGIPVYHIKYLPNEFLVASEESIREWLEKG